MRAASVTIIQAGCELDVRCCKYLSVVLRNAAIVVADNDVCTVVAESGHIGLAGFADDANVVLLGLLGVGACDNVVDHHGADGVVTLLGHGEEARSVGGELDSTDG